MTDDPFSEYEERTPRSRELYERAASVLPGGDTRSVTYHRPYPSFVAEASGATLTTEDGEILLDFLNNYTQSVLGHAPEPVVDAMCERLRTGNDVAAPTKPIIELAERLESRVPSIERVRFGNSGTEATMNAIRAAMAWTESERICKIEGGYHGTHDTVEVAVSGEGREHGGIPKSVEDRVDTVAYNDVDALKEEFEEAGSELACLVLEPIMGVGGMIPATDAFLETARDLTAETETILVFDEVMSFRLAPGGAQERRGVTPDLTALGKLVGGGLPVGAFGGRADLMEQFDPETGDVEHSGTFNGNPATMAGGAATLDELDERTIDRLNEQGHELRKRLETIGETSPLPVTVTGEGSLFQIHFTTEPVTDRTSSTAGEDRCRKLFAKLRMEGVFIAPRGMGNLSTPTGRREIDTFADAFETSLHSLS